ncbi:MAG: glutamate racemase [Rikenellaceae bacterium]|nr:glutamate racemase [Rikenellaceae bacterium]
MNDSPIGVFDSGMGGLTVWRELRKLLPGESLIYFGDGKNCPYGHKPKREVTGYVDAAVGELVAQGVKMVVVACNAATAAAIGFLRERYPIPFVGMEPAVKPAALSTRSGVVGILATEAALKGELFRATAARYADRAKIVTAVGEDFVEIVEAGEEDTPRAERAVRAAVEGMIAAGADRIVLGCTHYPFLEGMLRRVIDGRPIEIVNPAPAVARRAAQLLTEFDLWAEAGHVPEYRFLTAADEAYRQALERKSRQALEAPEGE